MVSRIGFFILISYAQSQALHIHTHHRLRIFLRYIWLKSSLALRLTGEKKGKDQTENKAEDGDFYVMIFVVHGSFLVGMGLHSFPHSEQIQVPRLDIEYLT